MADTDFRPRRSCLYMPGANPRALEKAKGLPADMLILDLEDAVAPDAKAQARETTCQFVSERPYGAREVLIRINDLDSEWGQEDLRAAVLAAPHGILVPKVSSANDIQVIEEALNDAGAPNDMGLWVMIELPRAILNIQDIASQSETSRLRGFVMGTNDLAKEMGVAPTADRQAFQVSLGLALLAARAYGLVAIDGVYNDIQDEAGFLRESEQGRVFGFDGKTLIHPAQIEPSNRVFTPDGEAVEQSRAVIDAFADPANSGKGVLKVNGKMVELLHLEQARRLVSISDAIDRMSNT